MKVTRKERSTLRRLLREGYTMAVFHRDGGIVPGYHDWALAWVLDGPSAGGGNPSAQSRSEAAGPGSRPLDDHSSNCDEPLLRTTYDDLGQAYREEPTNG
jgi:hypothetical protein